MDSETRRSRRKENRKRKAIALLAISELNDFDKLKTKKLKTESRSEDGEELGKNEDNENNEQTVEIKYLETSKERDLNRLTEKPFLDGEEYEALKKRLRERKKALLCNPGFRLKDVGEDAKVARDKRIPLFMSDIQNLLTYCMIGDKAPTWPNRWCTMAKWNKLTNLVCLVVDGVGVSDYKAHSSAMDWVGRHMTSLVEVVSPASYQVATQEEIALIPISVRQKKKLIDQFGSLESALEKDEAFKAFRSIFPVIQSQLPQQKKSSSKDSLKLQLLLSATQMVTENYPLPLQGVLADRYKDYKLTKPEYNEVGPSSPLYSVDCEMCLTDHGNELTRVCVVDSSLRVVYHTLVMPDNKIRNYLTQYSGITEDLLEGVTTKLSDVQSALQDLLPPDAILVGQSLNSDLVALQMMHPYIIDTSICFNITGDRRRKTKLSILAHLFLNRTIQTQGNKGHSPIEDAQAAMNLVLLKLDKGITFGDVMLGGQVPSMSEEGVYTVRTSTSVAKHVNLSTSLSKTLSEEQKTMALVCDEESGAKYDQLTPFKAELKLVKYEDSASKAVEATCTAALEHNFTICHLDLGGMEDGEERAKKTKKFAKKLHNFTSVNGMFMLLLGGTDKQNGVAGIVIRKPEES